MWVKKYLSIERILMILAGLGFLGGIYMIVKDRHRPPVAQPIMTPSFAPYKNYIAASGVVESQGTNVSVGTLVSGVVTKIMVDTDSFVKKGDPLFSLDQRQALADLELKQSALALAQENLNQAKVDLTSKKHLNDLIQQISDKQAVSQEEIITRKDNLALSAANLKITEAALENAEANLNAAKTNLDLLTVRAPADGKVLQVNVNEGEFVTATTSTGTPPVLFGNVNQHQIRIDIDENDAWKFKKNARAIAYLRGNTAINTPIHYSYCEPYVVPKTQLSGIAREIVDVRVLQVVYVYNPKEFPAYLGQQLDVYIEVPE
jgi:HlyD family secretion protein